MNKYLLWTFFLIFLSAPVNAELHAVPFPKTYKDLTKTERINNAIAGYEPFMDNQAYIVPGEEIYTDHMIAVQESETDDEIAEDEEEETPIQKTPKNSPYYGKTIGGDVVAINNQIIGGSCYPAAKDNHFTNKILTTGRYESISPALEKALITIFRKEGKCGTIKDDPCGYTCYGIGSSPECAGIVVKSRAEAEDYYYQKIWQKYKLYKLPDVISSDILIACTASGPGTALNEFRKFLGLTSSTSVVDDEMVIAVKRYNGDIHNQWINERNIFLQQVADNRYHGAQNIKRGYKNAIELKRKNGCHVQPFEPIYRQ